MQVLPRFRAAESERAPERHRPGAPGFDRSGLVLGRGLAARGGYHGVGDEAGIAADGTLDGVGDRRVFLEEVLGVLAALADALAVIGEPRARFLDHPGLDAEIDELAALGDALAVHDVEIDDLEGRRHLVLDHLDPRLVAGDLLALLDRADAANVEPHRGVEFQRVAARGGFRAAEHDADLEADLIDEDDHAARARDRAGQLAQRLAHQPRLQADMAVAHLALELGARHQRRHRIYDQHVDPARRDHRIA